MYVLIKAIGCCILVLLVTKRKQNNALASVYTKFPLKTIAYCLAVSVDLGSSLLPTIMCDTVKR